jgi:hypothetical protein
MKKPLLTLIALCISILGYSQTFTNSDFITYTVTSTTLATVKVTSYDITSGGSSVNIPQTVLHNSITYNVTAVGDSAFKDVAITSVIIPSSIISIENDAFRNTSLTNVTIPNSVTQMGVLCFLGNSQLTNLTLSNNLSQIPTASFSDCAITNVVIPNSVTNIGVNAFKNNQLTNITIPDNVVIISNGAFYGNPLTNVTSVKSTPPAATKDLVNDSFSSNRSNITLTIPVGSTSAYNVNSWSGFASVIEAVLSTSNFEIKNDIKVISTEDNITISYSNNVNFQKYSLFNLSGVKVITGKEKKFNTNTFASGIYILNIEFDKGILSKKVIID